MTEKDLTFYSAGLKLAATLYLPDAPAEDAYRTNPATAALALKLPLETADDLLTYRPEDDAPRVSPRPLFVIGAELDYIVDVEESRRLYEKALEPKRLVILPGMSHTDPYSKGLEKVVRMSADFLHEAMPGQCLPAGSLYHSA